MEREKFKSRLGFILISAGCAIGIGNVWRFPYVVGNNGGGCFVLFYVLFLVILGLPILTMEFSVGRASQQSIARAFTTLEKKGQFWHLHGYIGMAGNYILMMFYTTVAGWMLKYFFDTANGDFLTTSNSLPSAFPFLVFFITQRMRCPSSTFLTVIRSPSSVCTIPLLGKSTRVTTPSTC